MADAIVRLRVESSEYDQKLSRATQQLQHMEKEVRRTGATFAYADKEEIAFIQSLGSMETKATSARQKLREYSEAITSMTATYRNLTQEEKSSPFGQAIAASIDKLKAKAAELQDIMSDTQREIQNLASDTSFTQGLSMMTRTVGSCAAAITAWTGDSKEMEAVIKDLAKIGTTVAAVEQLTKAFQKQNLVLLKNPYVAAAAAVVALGVAIGKLIQKSQELDGVQKTLNEVQAKGRESAAKEITRIETLNNILHDNTRSLEDRKTALAEIQSLVPDYHGALTEEGNLINDNADALQGYINNLQRAAVAQAAFDKMVELQRKKLDQQVKLQEKQNQLKAEQARNQSAQGQVVYAGTEMTQVYTQQGENRAAAAVRQVEADIRQTETEIDALRNLVNASDIATSKVAKTGGNGGGGGESILATEGSIKAQEEEVARLTDLWKNATAELRDGYKVQLDEAKKVLYQMTNGTANVPTEPQELNPSMPGRLMTSFEKLQQSIRIKLADENFEVDQNSLTNLMTVAIQNGINGLDGAFEGLQYKLAEGLDIPDEEWQALTDKINEQLAALGIDPITLDVTTGGIANVTKDINGLMRNVQGAIGAFGQLGGAMQQIEDPSAKVAGIIMGAVAQVAATFAASLKGTFTPWDWIAAAISGTATMIATIAAIKSATKESHAGGGFIGGNSYSGDNMRGVLPNGDLIGLDSGELVLNAAQQSNLAGQLQGGASQNIVISGRLSGRDILLAANNDNRARGGQRGFYSEIH